MSSTKNPFALLEIEQTYLIDLESLTQKYIDKQRQFHPDMHVTKSSAEKLQASSMAVALNHAFEILKDPFQRGISLLHLKGIETNLDTTEHDFDILSRVMADQEKLDQVSTKQDLENLSAEYDLRLNKLQTDLNQAFEKNNNDLARRYLNSLKYLLKSKSDLDRKRRLLK